MNDFSAKPSSSALVVADTKAHRASGCVGIFFKLFDWNRRFGNKKLFPKKLLPPSRVNRVSKKFNADEKLPMSKHLLIADAKGGRFTGMNKKVNGSDVVSLEQRHEMRSPGLVAKLMGLESMPPLESKGPDKSRQSGNYDTKAGRFVGGLESDKDAFYLEKGCMKHELQPQKIQKTGVSERRPVTRFGADALQIRNALTRSRKRHPKLASPVKSPRVARSSSRLMDAAARILEPGLPGRSRTKCSLTYLNAMAPSPMTNEVNGEERMMIGIPTRSGYEVGDNPCGFKAQSSCQNCGHMDLKLDVVSETPLDIHNNFFQRVEESKARLGKHCEKESEVVLLRSRYQPNQRETVPPNAQNQWAFPENSSFHPERDVSPPAVLNHRAQVLPKSQPQMLNSGDKVPLRSRRVSSSRAHNQTKDFIALNRNVSQSSVRFPRKPSNVTEVRRQYSIQKSDATPPQRSIVRRTPAACKQVESTTTSRSTTERNRSVKSRVVIGNKASVDTNSTTPTCVGRTGTEGGNGSGRSKDIDVVSFSFSSPLKSKSSSFSPTQMDDSRMVQSGFLKNDDICRPKLVEEDERGKKSSNSPQMKEDAIGALLEQKLKELTHQAEYESRTGTTPQGRTTASILQELISALMAERPVSPDTNAPATLHSISQGKTRAKRPSMRFSGDHLSPGSVLDTSFSNGSCVSSSRDDASGHMFQSDDMDISYDEPRLMQSDADLLDSASSTIIKESGNYTIVSVTHLLDHISSLLHRGSLSNMKSYPGYANVVLLNAEMLFGNVGRPERFVDFLVGPFLVELETLAAAAWRSTVILGFDVSKGGNQSPLRTFLFDCLVECLDLRYARYIDSGFREWCKLPRQFTMEDLIQVFDYEVRRWASLAMMSTDDVIDWEMSTSLGKWTDFNLEGFESAAEMGQEIFQSLIDEVVADFL